MVTDPHFPLHSTEEMCFPRVSISTKYDLREIFKGLGVTDGFFNDAALSGIAEKLIALKFADKNGHLWV